MGTDRLADYIRWIGSLDFEKYPFREADALILCVISYFDLKPVFEGSRGPRVRDCLSMIEAGEARLCITGGDMGNTEIFREAARSARFGELYMTDYADVLRQEPALQYASVTFHDVRPADGGFSFIAYRGTDNTIAGWKEDFMISFTETEAQMMAEEYAEDMILRGSSALSPYAGGKALPEDPHRHRWYIGGHSKGGNQALYAACRLSDAAWEKVERVFLLDGPGLCREVMDGSLIDRIDPKTTRIIPCFDVIGKLFEPTITDTVIVQSYRSGIEQHSLASWLVDHGDLARTAQNDPRARWINEAFDAWIENIPPADRKVFIDEFFSSMAEGGLDNFDELDMDKFLNAVTSFRGKSDIAKKTLAELPKAAILNELDYADRADRLSAGSAAADGTFKVRLRDRIWHGLKDSSLSHALLLLAAGAAALLVSEHILEITAMLLVTAITLIQVSLTIRHLKKNRWNLEVSRERVILSIILIVLIVILLVKDDAMYLLGSVVAGGFFLVAAYITAVKASRTKNNRFNRIRYIVEAVLTAVFGLSFLVIPKATVYAYAVAIGTILIIDGLIRLAYLLVLKVRERQEYRI